MRWHRYERSQAFVGRALRMPDSADMGQVRAKYDAGVLTLTSEQAAGGGRGWGGLARGAAGEAALRLPPTASQHPPTTSQPPPPPFPSPPVPKVPQKQEEAKRITVG